MQYTFELNYSIKNQQTTWLRLELKGYRLDVFEGFDFSFNYGVADIRNPEKRSTEYSKTIKCPATKNNDALFGHIYDVQHKQQLRC